jgi:tripeptidyl-peptidase-1
MRGLLLLALQSVVIAVEQASSGITLTFYAKHQAELTERLRSILLNISDPRNEQYGQYLSLEQAAAYQQPAAESVRAIEAHVAELGGVIESRTLAGDKIVVRIRNTNVTAAEIVPTSLQLHVDLVDGPAAILGSTFRSLRNAPRPVRHRPERRMEVTKDPLECLADKVTAKCLRAAYGLNGTVGTNVTNGQAVVVNQMYKQSDLDAFLKESGLAPQKITHNIGKLDGSAGDEASLDTQFIIATGSQVPTWWVYIDGHAANPFSNWLVWASNNSAIPFVHSLSVGEPEGEAVDFIARMNAEMMALGARGISIIFASGDSGYAEEQKFGSSSPYVTSVGGVYNGDLGNSALEVKRTEHLCACMRVCVHDF